VLGFIGPRGHERAVGVGIGCAILFSAWVSGRELGWIPMAWPWKWAAGFDSYYAGIVGNALTFAIGYTLTQLWPGPAKRPSLG